MPGFADLPGTHTFRFDCPGQGTAGTADEWPCFVAPYNLTVTAVTFTSTATITGAATNNFKARVRNRTTGAGDVEVAGLTFDNAINATAYVPKAVTVSATAANLNIATGDVVSVEKIVNGTGLAMPDGLLTIECKVR